MNDIKFGIQLFYSQAYDLLKKKIISANKENWDSLWLPDHLSGMPGGAIDDFLALWPLYGVFSEIAKEKWFGSAVTDPHRMHPAVLGQIATTINHISGGKFILGMGAGEGMNLKAYNIPYASALTKMRESIELMKLFWKKGKRVNFKGKFFQTKKAVLLPKPISEIPVWIAANGPKTIQMTAEIADGWMPLGVSTDFYKSNVEKIKGIIQKDSSRDLSKFTFACFQRIFINDDEEKISEQIKTNKFGIALQPSFVRDMGYWKDEFDEIFCEATGYKCDEISYLKLDRDDVGKFDVNKLSVIVDSIPDEVIRDNLMIGTKEEVIKKIQKYMKLGAEYFLFELINGVSSRNAPFTYWDVTKMISEEIIPTIKGI
ncbi:MAG: LLM class flavin-dependent oxidoreductase [Candidatus Hodarchaeota archaeon]